MDSERDGGAQSPSLEVKMDDNVPVQEDGNDNLTVNKTSPILTGLQDTTAPSSKFELSNKLVYSLD